MKHFLQKLVLTLALAPLGLALAGLMYQAGYEKAARKAVRSFDGWTCTRQHTEVQRRTPDVGWIYLDVAICDQWTRPR